MQSNRPFCLMLDTTMMPESRAELEKIVNLIPPCHNLQQDILAQIKIAVCSPIQGFDSQWFDKLPALKLIAVFGVGLDKIDMEQARERGIKVTITRDILTRDTADMAFALLLAVTRQIVSGDEMIRSGQWAKGERLAHGHSLYGKTIGIVGLGAIGYDIARKAEIFGMKVCYYNRRAKKDAPWPYYDDLHELARISDILVIAIAATPQTEKIISASVLREVGTNGFIINIARGSVIDETALLHSLANQQIKGAGLDVFLNEPDINPAFFALPNVVLAPHQGSATVETRLAMGQSVTDHVKDFIVSACENP